MDLFNETFKYLKKKGFRRINPDPNPIPYKYIMVSEDYKIQVIIEKSLTELTEKEEENIKERLRELGYDVSD